MGAFDRVATDGTTRIASDGTTRVIQGIDGGVDAGSYSITGVAPNFKLIEPESPGTYAITGQAAGGKIIMPGTAGAYTITGDDPSLIVIHPETDMPTTPGVYAITGFDPTLHLRISASLASGQPRLATDGTGRVTTDGTERIVVGAGIIVPGGTTIGQYDITGADATFIATIKFAVDAGSYSIDGLDPEFTVIEDADSATYSITGYPAGGQIIGGIAVGAYSIDGLPVLLSYRVGADPGDYAITGNEPGATFIKSATGAYTITGTDPSLTALHTLRADAGSYSIDGLDASVSFRMVAAPGVYTIDGADADLSFIGPAIIEMPADPGVYSINGASPQAIVAAKLAGDAGVYSIDGLPIDLFELLPLPEESHQEDGRGGGGAIKEIPPHEWEVDLFRAKEYRRNFDMAVPPVVIANVALGSIASPQPRPASIPLPPFVKPQ